MKQGATSPKTLLRARGGISGSRMVSPGLVLSSPRTRRYFRSPPPTHGPRGLFSAHAEVFPLPVNLRLLKIALLRARGGISTQLTASDRDTFSSPRTRRYFHGGTRRRRGIRLFSAHAEVFPALAENCSLVGTLLRARGGISLGKLTVKPPALSSPRTRRYFRCFCVAL